MTGKLSKIDIELIKNLHYDEHLSYRKIASRLNVSDTTVSLHIEAMEKGLSVYELLNKKMKERCEWPGSSDLMITYHDKEWGKPEHDDDKLFEYLLLDSFQAGLSWEIVLKKRENFRKAFHNFNPIKISRYNKKDVKRLLNDVGIIRNKLKINATIINAKNFLEIKKEFGSFDKYIWQFTNHKTIKNKFKSIKELPAKTREAEKMSESLKEKGFKFVGPTICYAFMQGIGMVNDHTINCFRYKEL